MSFLNEGCLNSEDEAHKEQESSQERDTESWFICMCERCKNIIFALRENIQQPTCGAAGTLCSLCQANLEIAIRWN